MTDAEIIREVATKVMGWQEGYISTSLGHLPDSASWHNEDWSFSILKSVWNPLHNANHNLMVVERMRELGWYFSVHNELPQWDARFWTRGTFPGEAAFEYNFGTAVCLAALKALEEK